MVITLPSVTYERAWDGGGWLPVLRRGDNDMTTTAWAGDRSYNLKEGLDWDRIRAEHDARLATMPDCFVGGLNEEERSIGTGSDRLQQSHIEAAHMITTGSPHRRGKKNQWSIPKADLDEMVRLYIDEEMTVPEIGERLGYSPHSVRGRLVTAKVYLANRDKGKRS